MALDIIIICLLVLLGIFLLILEIFFLPGITVAGIGALLFWAGAVYYAFSQLGATAGFWTLGLSVVAGSAGIYWFIRSKSIDRMALKTDIDSVVPTSIDDRVAAGDRGITISRLNPMGTVLINETEMEAKTWDEFIDENTPVIVEKVNKTNIVVRKLTKAEKDNN